MELRPASVTDDMLLGWLARGWRIRPHTVTYAPVGRGSHHWLAIYPDRPPWFIKADPLTGAGQRRFADLTAAANTVADLAAAGHAFVIPPKRDIDGAPVRAVTSEWALQVFPYVSGRTTAQASWTDAIEHESVADILGRVHNSPPDRRLPTWNFDITPRTRVEQTLRSRDESSDAGPYCRATEALLSSAHDRIDRALRRYEGLVPPLATSDAPWVLTHGEPKSDNVIRADTGRLYLIDWDSAMVAPRERDLARLLPGPGDAQVAYNRAAGSPPISPDGVELFTLWWQLHHICRNVAWLRQPHSHTSTAAFHYGRLRRSLT